MEYLGLENVERMNKKSSKINMNRLKRQCKRKDDNLLTGHIYILMMNIVAKGKRRIKNSNNGPKNLSHKYRMKFHIT